MAYYLRCGAIARFSPAMSAVKGFARDGGLVLGICNGFQILCEAGLLPGVLPAGTYCFANAPHDALLAALGFALGPIFHRNRISWQDVGPLSDFPDTTYVPRVITLTPNIGEVGKSTVYIRKHNQAIDGAPEDGRPLIYRTLVTTITLARKTVQLTTGFFLRRRRIRFIPRGIRPT